MTQHFGKWVINLFILFSTILFSCFAQTKEKILTIEEAMFLAIKNHPQLAIDVKKIELHKQTDRIIKQELLPEIDFAGKIGYLGNGLLIEPDFKRTESFPLPHIENSLSLEAKQLIYKGNVVNKKLKSASLQEELAVLDLEKNQQTIKFLVAGYYLELLRLKNQIKVYDNNILLAKNQLANIQKSFENGIITKDEVFRSELQISNLTLGRAELENNVERNENELKLALGLSDSENIVVQDLTSKDHSFFKALESKNELNYEQAPQIRRSATEVELAENKLKIIKTELSPEIYAYIGSSVQRPITNVMPVIDKYFQVWSTGIALRYNIASLYKNKEHQGLAKINIEEAKMTHDYEKLKIKKEIKNAYLTWQLAEKKWQTYTEDEKLANENYRIVEKKYFNQLSILVDLINSSNQKLEAELKSTNARLAIYYSQFQLMMITGSL